MAKMKPYPQETENFMRRYYESLNERDRRRNAGIQAMILEHGGQNYIAKILADEIGIEVRITHYPPYCSKYNPIEHRLFPHITRACQGVVFSNLDLVTDLISKTRIQKGLKVFVHVIDKLYKTGRKVSETFKSTMRIVFDETLSKWDYCAVPDSC